MLSAVRACTPVVEPGSGAEVVVPVVVPVVVGVLVGAGVTTGVGVVVGVGVLVGVVVGAGVTTGSGAVGVTTGVGVVVGDGVMTGVGVVVGLGVPVGLGVTTGCGVLVAEGDGEGVFATGVDVGVVVGFGVETGLVVFVVVLEGVVEATGAHAAVPASARHSMRAAGRTRPRLELALGVSANMRHFSTESDGPLSGASGNHPIAADPGRRSARQRPTACATARP